MRNFTFLGTVDPVPLMLELQRQPELWNQNDKRQTYANTPHGEVDDIWVRWCATQDLDDGTARSSDEIVFLRPWYFLPALRPIVFPLMAKVAAVQLGAILITRIPAGGRVLPHTDEGWHARRFNTKVYVALQSNPDCINVVEDESINMKPGECWVFRNTVRHEVVNAGPDDRVSVICCLRCES